MRAEAQPVDQQVQQPPGLGALRRLPGGQRDAGQPGQEVGGVGVRPQRAGLHAGPEQDVERLDQAVAAS